MQPYNPQAPATPEMFAGRAAMQAEVRAALETAKELHRGSAMLLYGYRGSGKTSAVRKVESIVREAVPGAVIVEVPLRVPSSEAMLIRAVAEQVQKAVLRRLPLSDRVRRALETLSAVNVLGTGIERTTAAAPPPLHPLSVWNDTLEALEGTPLLCLCIDDAELLGTGDVGILKTMAEAGSSVPLLLIVAGGPELTDKLSQPGGSPILRAFSGAVFDIGQFSPPETREALEAPLRGMRGGSRWEASASAEVHHLTHGYPYLVQCFAAATYEPGRRITAEDVRRKTPAALEVASSWLEREFAEASDEDIRTFVKIARLGRSDLKAADLRPLKVVAAYVSRLERAGVLKRLARGHYELRMAPAVAYFHALRRGLAVD